MNSMNKLLVYNSKKIKLDKRSKKLRSLIVEGLIKSEEDILDQLCR